MQKRFILILAISLLLISLFTFLPFAIHAAEHPGLVTCGLMEGANVCNICDLITLFQTLVSQANVYFALPLAALMLGYGGFLMVLSGFQGGNAGLFTKGKTVLTNAIIGIVVIFCSWIAIDTLLKTIGAYQHAPSSKFGPWHVIECVSPVVKYPKHFACNGDKCEEVDGYSLSTCSTDDNSRSCKWHFGCDDKGACVVKNEPGFDKCGGTDDKTTCMIAGGTCAGVQCDDSGIDTYKPDPRADCTIKGNWDDAITLGLIKSGKIGGDIDTVKMVKAIMATESHGRIGEVSGAGACGLMQILPNTGKQYASACGAPVVHDPDPERPSGNDPSTCAFYTNPANAAKSICIGVKLMIKLGDGNCGKTIRNIAAGYNGNDACSPSADCGSAAGSGECKVNAAQTGETKRWECLWDDVAHTKCNAKKSVSNFLETRKYVPKVLQCYDEIKNF